MWEFALADPLTGVDGLDTLAFRPIRVPGDWQDQGFPGHGTGWYRLRFEVDPSVAGIPLAFATEQIRDADEVYLDGVLVGRTGGFPPRYEKATLMARVYELPPTLTTRPGEHVLAVRVHNPGPRAGGILGEPFLDSISAALEKRNARERPRVLLAAAIFALSLFSLVFYVRDREQHDFLYFALYTASFSLYLVTWLSAWAESSVSLSLLFRVNCAGSFALFSLFVLFFHRFFERPLSPGFRVLLGVQVAAALACLFWPRVDDLYYILWALHASVTVGSVGILVPLVRDSRHGVPHARPILGALVVVFLAVLHDIAQDLRLLGDPVGSTRFLGPAFLVFTVVFLGAVADRYAQLRVQATTDPLTGLSNRTVLFERLALEIARAKRYGHPVTLAVLDLDHFKRFNDRFGHQVGDKLLVAVAEAIGATIRDTDLAARYGGEEFVVLLPDAGVTECVGVLERIRKTVSAARVGSAVEGVTVSVGVTVFDPVEHGSVSVTALFRQADVALYGAKEKGRDRIEIAEGKPAKSSSDNFILRRRRSDSKGVPSERGRKASGA